MKRILYPLIKKRDRNVCISCGKYVTGANYQAGHYIKAELCTLAYRYNIHNINGQCGLCNLWKRGNTHEYRKNLVKKIGLYFVEQLEEFYNKEPVVDGRVFLEALINHYKDVKEL